MRFGLIFLLAGCSTMTEEAIEKQDELAYERMERAESFVSYKARCDDANGYVVIERWGKATRREVILNVPGRGDKVICTTREHR